MSDALAAIIFILLLYLCIKFINRLGSEPTPKNENPPQHENPPIALGILALTALGQKVANGVNDNCTTLKSCNRITNPVGMTIRLFKRLSRSNFSHTFSFPKVRKLNHGDAVAAHDLFWTKPLTKLFKAHHPRFLQFFHHKFTT